MSLTSLEPESSASANSAISANHWNVYYYSTEICICQHFFEKNLFFYFSFFRAVIRRFCCRSAALFLGRLRLFAHAVSKASQLIDSFKILQMHIAGKSAAVHVQLAVRIQIFLVDVHPDNLR